MFTCKRCGYESEYKHCLQNHLKRKTPCEITNEDISIDILLDELSESKDKEKNDKTYDCEYCKKKFNKCSNKSRHKKICKSKPKDTEVLVNELSEQVKKLQLKIDELQLPSGNNTTNTNITNNNNNTQNNININVKLKDFGKENMNAIPESLVSGLFMDLRFRELLSQLHCDPNFPENQNVRIRSVKRNTMEIYRNNKWDIITFSKGLTELLLQGHKIFKDYYKKDKDRILEEDMTKQEIKEILDQLDQVEKLNKEEIRPLLLDLQMMLEEYKETGSAIILN
jgi:hypothetical protein